VATTDIEPSEFYAHIYQHRFVRGDNKMKVKASTFWQIFLASAVFFKRWY
jgi:hypothetical protein